MKLSLAKCENQFSRVSPLLRRNFVDRSIDGSNSTHNGCDELDRNLTKCKRDFKIEYILAFISIFIQVVFKSLDIFIIDVTGIISS